MSRFTNNHFRMRREFCPSLDGLEVRQVMSAGPDIRLAQSGLIQIASSASLSFELDDLAPPAPTAGDRVALWLKNPDITQMIVQAEKIFKVDRRAIAGAIAWEAIENNSLFGSIRAVGVGKVHFKENRFSEGNPDAKQLEDRGYFPGIFPRLSLNQRKEALKGTQTSINYIAGIMSAYAQEAEKVKDADGNVVFKIRCDPVVLTSLYNGAGVSLSTAEARFRARAAAEQKLGPNELMGAWMANPANLAYIEAAIGKPDPNYVPCGEPVDTIFVIDTTSSMMDDIDAVKVAAEQLIKDLAQNSPDFRIGVVTYRDMGDDYTTKTDLAFTADKDAALSAIQAISVDGGGDFPEAVYAALAHAFQGQQGLGAWRGNGVRKNIILMGDAPPHDPDKVTGLTRADIDRMAAEGGIEAPSGPVIPASIRVSPMLHITTVKSPIHIYTVAIGSNAIDSFQGLAAANGGLALTARSAEEVAAALSRAISVSSAEADRFGPILLSSSFVGTRGKVPALSLNFNEPISTESSSQPANFVLLNAGKDRRCGTRDDQVLRISGLQIGADQRSVVLNLAKPIARTSRLRLIINGSTASGIRDLAGNLLDGDKDGQPGGNAVAKVFARKGRIAVR